MPQVKLYAGLRNIAGTKELAVPGATLGGVLDALAELSPALNGVIVEGGRLKPHFVITINGHAAADLGAPVDEGDLVAIFPPIAGGLLRRMV